MALIWAEETQLERRLRLSTQACPQSVWEKAEASSNTRRRRGGGETSVRGEEEREGGTPIREEHRRRERERREWGERGID